MNVEEYSANETTDSYLNKIFVLESSSIVSHLRRQRSIE